MSILVTGVPGWLGTRLVEIFRERGREVSCLTLPGLGNSYLRKIGARVVEGDLLDSKSLRASCHNIKTVFHCAGLIHPQKVKELYELNVKGTNNILEEAIKSGAERFIYISSNSAAGINTSRSILMRESDPERPYMNYGLSKHKAEELVNRAFREKRIKTTILRPCWFYGIRQPERQTRFFRMIKNGNPIIFGDGNNLRSLSYIDNIVEALLLAEQKSVSIGETYWVADRKAYPVIEIYRTIARLLGVKDFRPRFVPAFVSGACEFTDKLLQGAGCYVKEIHVAAEMTKDIACSIKKAQDELGYDPKIELEEGMERSIKWCKDNGVRI